MENKNPLDSERINTSGADVTTWALPEGAIARLGQGLMEVLAFSADGHYLAIGTRVGLWLYEVATMSPVALWGTERGAWRATFSPSGKWIATSDWDENIKVWDTHRWTCLTEITMENYPSTLAFSPTLNGSLQATAKLLLSTSGTRKRARCSQNSPVKPKKVVVSCLLPSRLTLT